MEKCNECGKEMERRYRFKCCLLSYCSVECYKSHNCTSLTKNSKTPEQDLNLIVNGINKSEPDIVKKEHSLDDSQLDSLKNDNELKEMLTNKELRRILVDVNNSDEPMNTCHKYMTDNRFQSFVSHLMGKYAQMNLI